MTKNNSNLFDNNLKKHFSKLKKQSKFIPGKSKIPLAIPPYGWEEVSEAIDSLLKMETTMSKKVLKFEKLFAKYIGVKHAIMVNSGSSANLLALSILSNSFLGKEKISDNNEIITPAVTWATTVFPIINIGAKPVFVDVIKGDYTIDSDKIEKAITKKTKAIFLVHLLGNPCNMNRIKKIAKKHDLFVIEDACEAHGAEFNKKKVGSFGDLATFSFFASHHITTMEGGMIVTNNSQLYEIGKALRSFGWSRVLKNKTHFEKKFPKIDPRYLFVNLGYNFRPTELQGAFGIHQIKKLDKMVTIRRNNAKFWNHELSKFSNFLLLPHFDQIYKHSFLFYPITVIKNKYFSKNDLVSRLENNGIETRPVMAGNFVNQPVAKTISFKIHGKLTNSNYIMNNSFVIGNHSGISLAERKFISDRIKEFISEKLI
tara:strand:- start:6518 stop:7801 length:1284 start_codon:yes stop_codon:yes gene_type:complete